MDVYEYLKQDHDKVDQLFKQTEGASKASKREELFRRLKNELISHTKAEEQLLYPATRDADETHTLTLEASITSSMSCWKSWTRCPRTTNNGWRNSRC